MAAKIQWLKEACPKEYKKVDKFINLTTYVTGKLANLKAEDAFIDCSVPAMNGLADIPRSSWNSSLIKKLGLDQEKLPHIYPSFEVVGYIDKDTFKTKNNIKVLTGIGDQIAGFIGTGILNKNDLVDVAGTYSVLGYCNDSFVPDTDNQVISSIYSGIGDIYYQLAVVAVGGYLCQWFLDTFSYNDKTTRYKETSGLYFIPHLGGRSAPSQLYYNGTFYGLKWDHDLDSIYIAMLESIEYEYYLALDRIKKLNKLKCKFTRDIKVIGGGTTNRIWNEIKTAVLDLNYLVFKDIPFEILGNYLIACYGINIKKGYKELEKKSVVSSIDRIKPKKDRIEYYSKYKDKYIRVVESIGKIYYQNNRDYQKKCR